MNASESSGLVLVSSLSSYTPPELKIITQENNFLRVGRYSRLARIALLVSRGTWLMTFPYDAKREQKPANIHVLKNVAIEWLKTKSLLQIYGRNQKNKIHLYCLPL